MSESLSILLDQAFSAHAAGDLPRAQQLYRQVLASQPNQPDSLQGLGIIASTLGDHPNAIGLFWQAINSAPNSSSVHTNFALVLLSANRVHDAISMGHQAIQLAPNCEQCLFNLASIYEQSQFWSEAIAGYQKLLEQFPNNVEAVVNLGNILFQQKQYETSLLLLQKTRRIHPNHPEVLFHLGKTLHALGQFDEALEPLQHALQTRPNWELALNQIGIVHLARGDCHSAIAIFKRVIDFSRQNVHAWYNLGVAFRNARRPSDAITAFREAIANDTCNAESYYQLGSLFIERGEIDAGLQAYESALAIRPGFGLGDYLHQLQYLCQWKELESITKEVLKQVDSFASTDSIDRISPFTLVGLPWEPSLEQLQSCGEHWAKTFPFSTKQKPYYRLPRHDTGHQRLRIGYLSADFRIHAVAFHLPELLSSQDRTKYEVFAFSLAPATESDIRSRIVRAVDHFIDIHLLDHAAAARRIADEEIDILVDLQGYTQLSRPEILALRPAPIQVSYLGYPGTMGASFIDYIVADQYVIRPEDEGCYSEAIAYLPDCYQVNDGDFRISEKTFSRAECGLPETGFIFCAFSTSYKITPDLFDVWMRLLARLPDSVLWLAEQNPVTIANLRREAQERGITEERLVVSPKIPLDQHVARHRLADLFLDTHPYNGHATTSIAIRAGVPVVTLSGKTFASRVAGSILKSLRLEDCIASTFQEYEEIAWRFATDRDSLNRVREQIAASLPNARLFDGRRFAVDLGKAFDEMFRQWVEGNSPKTFHVADDLP